MKRVPWKWPLAAILLLFGLVGTAMAEDGRGWLLPESISEQADQIDNLFLWIFWITGVVFVGTEGLLLYFIVKYRAREGGKALYTHGNHTLELVWTAIPAVILAVIAFVQFEL